MLKFEKNSLAKRLKHKLKNMRFIIGFRNVALCAAVDELKRTLEERPWPTWGQCCGFCMYGRIKGTKDLTVWVQILFLNRHSEIRFRLFLKLAYLPVFFCVSGKDLFCWTVLISLLVSLFYLYVCSLWIFGIIIGITVIISVKLLMYLSKLNQNFWSLTWSFKAYWSRDAPTV